MCGGGGERLREREGKRMRKRERTSGLSQGVIVCLFFFIYFVSCNGPCALKEKWHRKEHVIIIIIIKPSLLSLAFVVTGFLLLRLEIVRMAYNSNAANAYQGKLEPTEF